MRGVSTVRWTAALAVLAAAISLLGLIELNTGFGLGAQPFGFALSDGYEAASFASLETISAPNLANAEAMSRRVLALSPYENSARLRLAYVDFLRHGRLGPEGIKLFSESYDLLPVDQNVAAWRIGFALEHWQMLTPQERDAVRKEAAVYERLHSGEVDIDRILGSIRNPNGRLAAALWAQDLSATGGAAPGRAAPF